MRRSLRLRLLRLLGRLLHLLIRPQPRELRRVLVIKPDHLGDVLLLTPALRLLRRQRPDLHLTLLIGPWSRVAVAHNRDIDVLLSCEFPGFTRAAKPGWMQPYRLLLKTALLLRAGRYDTALIVRDDHWWGALLALLAGIPQRIGFAVPETAPLLTTALPHSFDDHVAAQNLQLVTVLTGEVPSQQPLSVAPIGVQDRAWAARWLEAHGVVAPTRLVAIHPGSGGPAKLWVATRWVEIADALHARGLTVILSAGPDERVLVSSIADALKQPPLTLIGEATLGQLAAIYERCDLVLGVDSGPLHLAVATGVPTLVLFGPGNPQRFGPWGDPQRHVVLRSDLWCSPCGVLTACPRGTAPSECMARIAVAQVLTASDALLDQAVVAQNLTPMC